MKKTAKRLLAGITVCSMVLQAGFTPAARAGSMQGTKEDAPEAIQIQADMPAKGQGSVLQAEEQSDVAAAEEMQTQQPTLPENSKTAVYEESDYDVAFQLDNQWEGQFQATVTITNRSEKEITDWNLQCYFLHDIDQIWNAEIAEHKDNVYRIKNVGWNSAIAAGASVSLSFIARWNNTYIEAPRQYELYTLVKQLAQVSCPVTFEMGSQWGSGFEGAIKLTNNTDYDIDSWRIAFDLDCELTNIWNGQLLEHSANHYVIGNCEYNRMLAAGQTVTINVQGMIGDFQTELSNVVVYAATAGEGTELPEPTTEEVNTEETEEPTSEEVSTQETEEPTSEEVSTQETEEPTSEEVSTQETEEPASEEVSTQETEEPTSEEISTQETEEPTSEEASTQETEEPTSEEVSTQETEEPTSEEVSTQETEEPTSEEVSTQETEEPTSEEVSEESSTEEPPRKISSIQGIDIYMGNVFQIHFEQVEGAVKYRLWRKTSHEADYELYREDLAEDIKKNSGEKQFNEFPNVFIDTYDTLAGKYFYRLEAIDALGVKAVAITEYEQQLDASRLKGAYISSSAKLIWTEVPGAHSYTLYRAEKYDKLFQVVAENLVRTEYLDTTVEEGKIYTYYVTADANGVTGLPSPNFDLIANEDYYQFELYEDWDDDGLTNVEELMAGTDLTSKDTDGDGLCDGEELAAGRHTDPLNPDTDGDGIYDGAETLLGLDPLTPNAMGSYTATKKSKSERVSVTAVGDSNLIVAPWVVKECGSYQSYSFNYIIGEPVHFTCRGYQCHSAQMTFSYLDTELTKKGLTEDELSVYRINYDKQKVEPVAPLYWDKEKNLITVEAEEYVSYALGSSKTCLGLCGVDIVFAFDQSDGIEGMWSWRKFASRFIDKLDMDLCRVGVAASDWRQTNLQVKPTYNGNYVKNVISCVGVELTYAWSVIGLITDAAELFDSSSRKKMIIVLSNADKVGSWILQGPNYYAKKGISVYSVAGHGDAYMKNDILLDFASETGGGYYELNDIYKEPLEEQTDVIYNKITKSMAVLKEIDSDLPNVRTSLEFSDLYAGIDSREAQEWMTTASTNLLTGNYVYDETDIEMQGSGYNLSFSRTYNSMSNDEDSILGKGYRTNFETKIEKKESSEGENVQIGRVNAGRINVRADAGTDKAVIGKLARGTTVKITGSKTVRDSLWYKIDYKGKNGYVAGWQIKGAAGYEVTFPTGTKIFYTEHAGEILANNSTDAKLTVTKDGYLVENADFTSMEYNKDGKLTALCDRYGNRLTVSYADGKLSRAEDAVGRYLEFAYGENGLLASVTDSTGRTATYEYNNKKQLTSVTDVLGYTTQYKYNSNTEKLTIITDTNGKQILRNDYDVLGRVIRQYDAKAVVKYFIYDDEIDTKAEGVSARYMINENGEISRTTFNADLKPVKEQDVLGKTVKYRYEYYNADLGKWIDITTKREGDAAWETYDDYRFLHRTAFRETVTDKKGNETVTEYDKNGNPVKITDALGNTETREYDSHNNPVKITDKAGNKTVYDYDDTGVYLKRQTDALKNSVSYTYYDTENDANIKLKGLLKTQKDSRGAVTTYTYDKQYNHMESVTDALGHTIKTECDALGWVTVQTDGNGNQTTYKYDAAGRVTHTTEANGKIILCAYNPQGSKTQEINKWGYGTCWYYDAKNQLVMTNDPMGYRVSYFYDRMGNVIMVSTGKGTTVYSYDALGRKITEQDALGNITSYTYDDNDNLISICDRRGGKTLYEYDALNRVTAEIQEAGQNQSRHTTYKYDALGNVIEEKDSLGYTIKTDYDALGRELYKKDKTGNTITTQYDDKKGTITQIDSLKNRTIIRLDLLSNTESVQDALGNVTSYEYDANGNVAKMTDAMNRTTLYTYNALNLLQTKNEQYVENGEIKDCITTYRYDANGNKNWEKDANGNVKSWTYDRNNRLTEEIFDGWQKKTYSYDCAGNVTILEDELKRSYKREYDALSRMIEERDPLGNTTQYSYDSEGNMILKTDAAGNTTAFQYDYLGNMIEKRDANGNKETYAYDPEGNNISRTDRNGNTTTYEYGGNGQLLKSTDACGGITTYKYDVRGLQTEKTDARNQTVTFTYDALGRTKTETNQAGDTKTYSYDKAGNLKTVTDCEGHTTKYSYDDFDRLVSVTDAEGGITVYTYDKVGNLTSRTDGDGRTVSYAYDFRNQMVSMTDSAGKTEIYAYDMAGNLRKKTDRNGVITTYAYDGMNRLLVEKAGEITYTYTYDSLGNLLSVTDNTGTTSYSYDNQSRLTAKTYPSGQTIGYAYDKAGNRLSTEVSGGAKTCYTYDSMNRIETVSWDGGAATYAYDENGNQTGITISNGMQARYTFDSRNLLTDIENTGPDRTMETYHYTYDKNGLLTKKEEPKGDTAYEYSRISQLTKITEPDGRTTAYSYDGAGNRTGQQVTWDGGRTDITYKYDKAGRLEETVETTKKEQADKDPQTLTGDSPETKTATTAYQYDNNGNQISARLKTDGKEAQTIAYTYDALNQLIHYESTEGGAADYTYYATGLRASKTVNGNTVTFLYDGQELLAGETNGALATNILGNAMVATVGADTLYYQYNNHKDVIKVYDGAGTLKNRYDYDAFGNAITAEETVANPYRYAGYYQDTESGLYYLKSRYYDAETARFLTEDTASGKYTDPLSLNKYTYCHNQPVTGYDPDGHFLKEIFFGGAVGGAFGAGKAIHDNWANRKTLGLGGMMKTAFAGFASGTITGMAAGATFSTGGMVLKAGGGMVASMLTGFAVGAGTGAASGAAGSAVYQGITAGQVNKEQVKLAAISTGAGLAAAGAAAPALGAGNKAVSKVLGKALQRFGMGESAAAAAAGIATTAFGGGAVGAAMGAGGEIAGQGYLISQGYQNSFDWKQFGKTTCGAVIAGTAMGAAFGAAGQTKAGSRFFQWLETPTQFEQNAAKGIKQFLGDNRGTASIEALLGKGGNGKVNTDYYVTPNGDVIPANKGEFYHNLSLLNNNNGKYIGETTRGSVRIRVEAAHPPISGYTGNTNNDHLIDHIHIEYRQNGLTGPWGKGEGKKISIPQSWLKGDN